MINDQRPILIYAFTNQWGTNVSHRTLLELQKIIKNIDIKFQLIRSYPQEFFRKYIQGNLYNLIIGLGDNPYDKIRIETQAKNSYNDKSIYPFSPILLDLSLPNLDNFDSNYFVISSNMGTYNCNWMAYSTQLYINQKKLETKHIFLHLPKRSNASILASQINNLLILNGLI